jgi:hypothetical protein
VQDARKSQFLEGDIRMAQQYAALDRKGLDLQQKQLDINQDMINFNKKMLVAKTIIQRTQAAVSLTNAAVNLGGAIQNYHDQKSNLAIQTGTTQYQAGVTEAITNGYNPYATEKGENGETTRRYVGFDGYKMADGRTLGDLKQGVIDNVGKNYWTSSGADRGMQIATNAFENIELGAQKQMANEVMKNRQVLFDQQLTSAIEVFRQTGDRTQLNTVMDSATWMSEDQWNATNLAAERQANLLNINDTAMSIARSQDMGAVQTYLAEQIAAQNINEEKNGEIFLNAQKARDIAMKPEQERLNGKWETETANATPATAERLKAVLQGQQHEFEACDNENSYYDYMRRLVSLSGSSKGSGMSQSDIDRANANAMADIFEKYKRNEIGIDDAMGEMNGFYLSQAGIHERNNYYKLMLEYKDPLTAQAFARYDELCDQYKVDDAIRNDMREILSRSFSNNEIRSRDRIEYIERTMDEQIIKNVSKALKPGVSWSEAEQKKQNELSYNGRLDPYFAPVGEEGRHEMEVSGAGEVKKNVINYSRGKVEDAIKVSGFSYIKAEPERRGENDETGRIFHIIKNENGEQFRVIVNPDGKLEKKEEDGRLVSFDSELSQGRTVALERFEASLPEGFNNRVQDELNKTRGSRIDPAARYRDILTKELGNVKASTDIGRAYIDAKVRELLGEGAMRIYGYK